MKKYLYEITIGVLALGVGVSSYYLYSQKEVKIPALEKKHEVVQQIDIKDEKNKNINKFVSYKPNAVDTQKTSAKMAELKKMLSQTQKMLKEYNSQNQGNIIIKNDDIDKLVSLDLQQNNILPSKTLDSEYEADTKKAKEIDSLEKQDKVSSINNTELKTKSSSSSVSTSTSSTTTTQKSQTTTNSSTASSGTTTSENKTSDNSEIKTELETLQSQIDDIKKTINQVSANIN